jgi:type I restriction enzyme S subunit
MNGPWPRRAMAEVAPLVRRPVRVDPESIYHEIGIRSFARGIFHKPPTTGLEIGQKRVFAIQPGDLLFNIVFAWEGAVAVASDSECGTIGSHRFLTCVVNSELADTRYLFWWFSCGEGRELLLRASPGGAGRNRTLGVDKLAAIHVPLPPLDEQRRAVSRIDAIAGKLIEAKKRREQATAATNALVPSLLHEHFVARAANWARESMNQIVVINDKQVNPILPEYSGLPHINGENIESGVCRLLPYRTAAEDGVRSSKYLFSSGTVLYSKIRPYLRKSAFVEFDGLCSADIYPLRLVHCEVEPHFLKWALIAEPFTSHANKLSGRTRMPKLNRNQLFSFGFAFPPRREQLRIVEQLEALQNKTGNLQRLQRESFHYQEAMLPATLHNVFRRIV